MPFLESRKSRTRRVFQEALAEALQTLAEVAADHRPESAWVTGGCVTAILAVTDVDPLKRLWGKGNKSMAMALIEVFTYPMISRWYKNIERELQVAEDQRQLARRIAASNISALFGSRSEQLLDDFMKMDSQFNYERDWIIEEARPGMPGMEAQLLLSKALVAWVILHALIGARLHFPLGISLS